MEQVIVPYVLGCTMITWYLSLLVSGLSPVVVIS